MKGIKTDTPKRHKICFAASTGGHFEQLMKLRPIMYENESFIITEKTAYKVDTGNIRIYCLRQINRKERMFLVNFVMNTFSSFMIFMKEKPDVVISTGVLAVIPICLLAKFFHKKIIYIESFAKVTSPTQTGKLLYRFADKFYVQWEEMLQIYPKSIYKGGIY